MCIDGGLSYKNIVSGFINKISQSSRWVSHSLYNCETSVNTNRGRTGGSVKSLSLLLIFQ